MRVILIGSGNVATVLGKIIVNSGHEIVQVLSRNRENAKALANLFECAYDDYLSTTYQDADIYIFAVADNALHHLDVNQQLQNKIVVHTAGSVSKDVLSSVSQKYGVIYPLQSLNKTSGDIPLVPLLIDGNSTDVLAFIEIFAQSLSPLVSIVNDMDRLKFHIAGVFVNNFTNHLYAMADDFCAHENIDFNKLFPLINETTKRIRKFPAKDMQTGPALRQDLYTIGKHLKMLSADPDLKYIYLKLSESILRLHKIK